ncbi:MAG: hypothetical protein PF795_05405 [Kiritimatiellae bacterium]|nr:hypothetical protein [Kiritimatiellia bacterium]
MYHDPDYGDIVKTLKKRLSEEMAAVGDKPVDRPGC